MPTESKKPLPLMACPAPWPGYDRIVMGHGSGGRLSSDLLKDLFLPAFENPVLSALEDQARVRTGESHIAFTTDAFVIKPLFFPGGDIGKLSVCGTINDLAAGGAMPLALSAAFIMEEGLELSVLKKIVDSMANTCREAGISLVCGDTKVVDKGKGDQLFITTSGIGTYLKGSSLSIAGARPGDLILVSGTIGDHGMAVMSVREGIEFDTTLQSDCTFLHEMVRELMQSVPDVRCMRDPTRGGLSAVLNEMASASKVGVVIRERDLPIHREVRGACEILGLDPLQVANEGKMVVVVPASRGEEALHALRRHPKGRDAAIIGEVVSESAGKVRLQAISGSVRMVSLPAGELLPRIC